MEDGKKPSTDLDTNPAKFPAKLDVAKELEQAAHPGTQPQGESKRRKRLTFDEVSNVVIEGVGDGPIKSGKMLERAAKKLKCDGKVELWNYVGDLKDVASVSARVEKVWRLQGENQHPLWCVAPEYKLNDFDNENLALVQDWRTAKHGTHVLVLSGDGGYGKTSVAEALMFERCLDGFFGSWTTQTTSER